MKVSVVILSSKVSSDDSKVRKCIDSIKNQDYKNKEFLIVSCGGKEEYSLAEAMNRGVKDAKGELVMFMFEDDWINEEEKDYLSRCVDVHINKPYVGFTYSDYLIHSVNGVVQRTCPHVNVTQEGIARKAMAIDLIGNRHILLSGCVFKKEVFYTVGFANEFFKYLPDYELFLRTLTKFDIYKIPENNNKIINYGRTDGRTCYSEEIQDYEQFAEAEVIRERYNLQFKENRKTCCAMLCVKNESAIINDCLNDLSMYADHIVVFDDGSYDNTVKLCKKWKKVTYLLEGEKKGNDRSEGKDRQKILELAYKTKANYFLFIDSITGDRCIPIKYKGKIDVISIKELFCKFSKDNKIINFKGKEAISMDNNDLLTLSAKKVENDGRIKGLWEPIKKIIRHKTNKKIYQLKQRNGLTKVTEDHSLITIKNNKLTKTKIKELKESYVPSISYIERTECLNNIDLLEYLDNNSLNFTKDYLYKKISNEVEERKSYIKNDKKSYRNWYYVNKENYKRQKKSQFKRHISQNLLGSFCSLLGAYVSEGSCSDRDFSIANSDYNWILSLKEDLKLLFDGKIRITIDKTHTGIIYYLRTSDKILRTIFGQLGGIGSQKKKIPSFIYNLDYGYQKIFFDNLMKGDGSYSRGKYPTYTTVSLRLCSGLCLLLKYFNLNYNLQILDKKGKRKRVYQININITARKWKKISSKYKEINNEEGYVYDLQVEGSKIFVDGCGLLLLHNTDEIFEDRYKTEIFKEMRNRTVKLWFYHEINFWRHPEYHRIDELYDTGWFGRLFKASPKLKYNVDDEHCCGIPNNIPETRQWFQNQPTQKKSNIRVKHYGFRTANYIIHKVRQLWQRDTIEKVKRHERYDRLLIEKTLRVNKYFEKPYYLPESVSNEEVILEPPAFPRSKKMEKELKLLQKEKGQYAI